VGVMMVTSRVTKDKVSELEAALGIVFSALDTEQSENVRYMIVQESWSPTRTSIPSQ